MFQHLSITIRVSLKFGIPLKNRSSGNMSTTWIMPFSRWLYTFSACVFINIQPADEAIHCSFKMAFCSSKKVIPSFTCIEIMLYFRKNHGRPIEPRPIITASTPYRLKHFQRSGFYITVSIVGIRTLVVFTLTNQRPIIITFIHLRTGTTMNCQSLNATILQLFSQIYNDFIIVVPT